MLAKGNNTLTNFMCNNVNETVTCMYATYAYDH